MYKKFGCKKQLRLDSTFSSVLFYTILLCISNYTFTARSVVMSFHANTMLVSYKKHFA